MPTKDRVHAAAQMAVDLEFNGYAVVPGFVPVALVGELRARAQALDAAGALQPAAIGRGAGRAIDALERGDRIGWIDGNHPAERVVLDAFEHVRLAMNRHLSLGLFDLEAHYAMYPAGARYAPHRDSFRDDDARVLSCVLYLNDDWRPADGGALRLHLHDGSACDVPPVGGTLVTFLSARFVHEVLPATRVRVSLTGWFRRRAIAAARIGADRSTPQ